MVYAASPKAWSHEFSVESKMPSPVETAEVRGGRLAFEGVGKPQNRNSRAEAQMTTKIF